jgi:hypothetical protein
MSTPEHPPGSPEAVTHEYEEMTPEKRPQDHPRRNGRGLRFVTAEHGGEYPDMMPQALGVLGRKIALALSSRPKNHPRTNARKMSTAMAAA